MTSRPASLASALRITLSGQRERLLIVDDDPEMRSILCDVLQERGYETIEAAGGEEALAILRRSPEFDLLLLDIEMPDLDGYAILEHLKSLEELRHLPVIFLSGRTTVEDTVYGLTLGAADYIPKPCDFQELLARMGQVLRVKRTLDKLNRDMKVAERLSMTDPLTALPNRRAFEHRLQQETESARRLRQHLGCLVMDVDHFKALNDRFGHLAGDAVLREVARALQAGVRALDMVARLGGDEFVVLLPGADLGDARKVAEALRRVMGALRVQLDTGEHAHLAVSIGVAVHHGGGSSDGTALLKEADSALFCAKRSGRDRIVCAPSV